MWDKFTLEHHCHVVKIKDKEILFNSDGDAIGYKKNGKLVPMSYGANKEEMRSEETNMINAIKVKVFDLLQKITAFFNSIGF